MEQGAKNRSTYVGELRTELAAAQHRRPVRRPRRLLLLRMSRRVLLRRHVRVELVLRLLLRALVVRRRLHLLLLLLLLPHRNLITRDALRLRRRRHHLLRLGLRLRLRQESLLLLLRWLHCRLYHPIPTGRRGRKRRLLHHHHPLLRLLDLRLRLRLRLTVLGRGRRCAALLFEVARHAGRRVVSGEDQLRRADLARPLLLCEGCDEGGLQAGALSLAERGRAEHCSTANVVSTPTSPSLSPRQFVNLSRQRAEGPLLDGTAHHG